ncbi:MAG: carboxylesterase [Desulfobulbaceae bacterium]|nr:MAG: carboxylesterase [Desulfobulbaceae bacterium]
MELLPARVIETGSNPSYAVIWLHGLGADGNDFAPIVPELHLEEVVPIRFIFPHAPQISVTVNGGFVMPAWYDIYDMQIDRRIDLEGLNRSAGQVNRLIEAQIEQGIAAERIIVAGFSQGGAVAFEIVLNGTRRFGGLLAMSTYFATAGNALCADNTKSIPIEIHHGLHDQVVPEQLGQKSVTFLKSKGYQLTYRTYPMDHSVCVEQIRDIGRWFSHIISP